MTQTPPYHYAGFWRRSLGWFVDLLLLEFATMGVMLVWYGALMLIRGETSSGEFWHSFALGYFVGQGPDALFFQIVETIVYFLIAAPYTVILTHRYGWTLGKKLVRARAIDFKTGENLTMARSWGRFFASGLSFVVAGCGYFMAALHPKKFTLHDLLARTAVIVAPCIAIMIVMTPKVFAEQDPAAMPTTATIHWVTDAMFYHAVGTDEADVASHGRGSGLELGMAAWFAPFAEHDFEIGPRVGVTVADRNIPAHVDGTLGLQASLWFLNAMGIGLEVDSVLSRGTGVRVDPFVEFRLKHIGDEGALGLRAGAFHDSRYGWGYQVGLAMEWDGVK